MDSSNNLEGPKANIASLYNRVASIYGRVGPDPFAYAGKGLVERIGIHEGARVLDVGVGRGANLFPAAEKVGPHGKVIGIDLPPEVLAQFKAEVFARLAEEQKPDGIHEEWDLQYVIGTRST
jgi:O-methyltransferase/aklanonic acid methyltransferase